MLSRKHKNLYLLGRNAEYKYYDMDDAIVAAFNLFDVIKF
jgi:UDP-galactopyranose mutase